MLFLLSGLIVPNKYYSFYLGSNFTSFQEGFPDLPAKLAPQALRTPHTSLLQFDYEGNETMCGDGYYVMSFCFTRAGSPTPIRNQAVQQEVSGARRVKLHLYLQLLAIACIPT